MRLHRIRAPPRQMTTKYNMPFRMQKRDVHSHPAGPIAAYDDGVKSGRLREDAAQRHALQKFNRLYQDLKQ